MTSSNSGMRLLRLPREIRDLIYSFIVLSEDTYLFSSTNPYPRLARLPLIIFKANPKLGILWTSRAILLEVMESICAISTIRFIFSRGNGILTATTPPVSEDYIKLMKQIEINMDLLDCISSSPALRMLGRDKIKRKSCRVTINNQYLLLFDYVVQGFLDAIAYLEGFETVIVVQRFKQNALYGGRPRWYMESILGPSREWSEDAAVCNEFHPREFLAKRSRSVAST